MRLAKASVEKGQTTAKQCQACHTFEKGGPNRVGPNLWNIVDDERGKDRNGFNFSTAMKGKGGKWTFEELDKFLTDPRGYISGTAMTFAGIKNDQQRADVIDYLHTLADNPVAAADGGGSRSACGRRRQSRPRRRKRRRSDARHRVIVIRPGKTRPFSCVERRSAAGGGPKNRHNRPRLQRQRVSRAGA